MKRLLLLIPIICQVQANNINIEDPDFKFPCNNFQSWDGYRCAYEPEIEEDTQIAEELGKQLEICRIGYNEIILDISRVLKRGTWEDVKTYYKSLSSYSKNMGLIYKDLDLFKQVFITGNKTNSKHLTMYNWNNICMTGVYNNLIEKVSL